MGYVIVRVRVTAAVGCGPEFGVRVRVSARVWVRHRDWAWVRICVKVRS